MQTIADAECYSFFLDITKPKTKILDKSETSKSVNPFKSFREISFQMLKLLSSKLRGSSNSKRYIIREPWMFVQNFMASPSHSWDVSLQKKKNQPPGDTGGNDKGSPKSGGFSPWGPQYFLLDTSPARLKSIMQSWRQVGYKTLLLPSIQVLCS